MTGTLFELETPPQAAPTKVEATASAAPLARQTHTVKIKHVKAKFDAAMTTPENSRLLPMLDAMSADAAHNVAVRKRLRERARYEVANNSYAIGIINSLADYIVGRGPRLQMLTDDPKLNSLIEESFNSWAEEIGLAEKLRTMVKAKKTDGEAFGALITNNELNSQVLLDVKLFESEQCADSVFFKIWDPNYIDGIELDVFGNPKRYCILKYHPGDMARSVNDYQWHDASNILHWFRADRPGQHRGVSELTPALNLFWQLRRYTLAVLAAAETVADYAAVLYTDTPAEDSEDAPEPYDVIDLERRMATALPDGWKLGQIKAEQPTTTYGEFKREILCEVGRCLNIPRNITLGDSSGYNYSSGRLDHQSFFKSTQVEQNQLASVVLKKIMRAWFAEARVTIAPQLAKYGNNIPFQWFFDGYEHVDPKKEADAQTVKLGNLTTTLAYEYARAGRDWETELRQMAKERQLMAELGLSPAAVTTEKPKNEDDDDDDEKDDK